MTAYSETGSKEAIMDNRFKILTCALDLFSARGYEGIGVQEIVDAAGITKPTLYHYFGSKEGLLTALLEEYSERLCGQLTQAAEYHRDITLNLERLADAYFRFALANPKYFRLQLAHLFAPPESAALKIAERFSERQFRIIENLFLSAAQDHGNMKGRHQRYALTFIGMINSYATLALVGNLKMDDSTRHQAVHQFMHGIFS
jgi:AcrR family transcriptional regulator